MKKLSELLKESGLDTIPVTGTDDMNPMKKYHQSMVELHNKQVGNLNLEDGYNCPVCKNRGFISKLEQTEFGYWTEMKYLCECQKKRQMIREMKKSGLQSIIGRYTFKSYKTDEPWRKEIKEKAIRFVQERQNAPGDDWFYIGGASGSGKTHICTAICREFLFAGMSVRYMLWRDDSVKLKACLSDYAEYNRMMRELKTVDVLYIDDLFKVGYTDEDGRQKPTAADINLAFELLNYRYNNPELITIISSECTTSDLLSIDEAVGGRVIERAIRFTSNLTGENRNYRTKLDYNQVSQGIG